MAIEIKKKEKMISRMLRISESNDEKLVKLVRKIPGSNKSQVLNEILKDYFEANALSS